MRFDVSAFAIAASFTAGWAMIQMLASRADTVFQVLITLALGLLAVLALLLALRVDLPPPPVPPPAAVILGTRS